MSTSNFNETFTLPKSVCPCKMCCSPFLNKFSAFLYSSIANVFSKKIFVLSFFRVPFKLFTKRMTSSVTLISFCSHSLMTMLQRTKSFNINHILYSFSNFYNIRTMLRLLTCSAATSKRTSDPTLKSVSTSKAM